MWADFDLNAFDAFCASLGGYRDGGCGVCGGDGAGK